MVQIRVCYRKEGPAQTKERNWPGLRKSPNDKWTDVRANDNVSSGTRVDTSLTYRAVVIYKRTGKETIGAE